MFQAQTFNLNHYKGTPEGMLRLGFSMPDGNNRSAFIRNVGADWDVSLFVDETTETMFFVGTSPDKRGLIVERWLNFHVPTRKEYATKAAQKEDLGNKDAGMLSHEQVVEALKAALTEGDEPKPIVKVPLKLVALTERKTKRVDKKQTKKGKVLSNVEEVVQDGDYQYNEGTYSDKDGKKRTKPSWRLNTTKGAAMIATKGDPSWSRHVFRNEANTEVFFLFVQPSGDYLLEAVRETRTSYQRREAAAKKADMAGKKPEDIVIAMADSLAYNPTAFA